MAAGCHSAAAPALQAVPSFLWAVWETRKQGQLASSSLLRACPKSGVNGHVEQRHNVLYGQLCCHFVFTKHRITDSARLEKTLEIIKSNLWPNTTLLTKPFTNIWSCHSQVKTPPRMYRLHYTSCNRMQQNTGVKKLLQISYKYIYQNTKNGTGFLYISCYGSRFIVWY